MEDGIHLHIESRMGTKCMKLCCLCFLFLDFFTLLQRSTWSVWCTPAYDASTAGPYNDFDMLFSCFFLWVVFWSLFMGWVYCLFLEDVAPERCRIYLYLVCIADSNIRRHYLSLSEECCKCTLLQCKQVTTSVANCAYDGGISEEPDKRIRRTIVWPCTGKLPPLVKCREHGDSKQNCHRVRVCAGLSGVSKVQRSECVSTYIASSTVLAHDTISLCSAGYG
jgi:hypothetical protein